jgi:ATP-dependent Clp protease ATP-binding subunit ClpC
MFERFTDRARRVVVSAQEEARMHNHDHIGTEHLLLGLIHEGEGAAVRALESLEISLAAVRYQVEEMIGQGSRRRPGPSRSPRAPRRRWSSRCGSPGGCATATSAPGTSCWA